MYYSLLSLFIIQSYVTHSTTNAPSSEPTYEPTNILLPSNHGDRVRLVGAMENEGAMCLDGSPAIYYINEDAQEHSSYVMFLEGGGWCSGIDKSNAPDTTIDSCMHRRHTRLGSTVIDEPDLEYTKDLNSIDILGNDPFKNPLFHNWVKIFVRYCDGASFSGDREDPLFSVNDRNRSKPLFFRGKRILDALFEDLFNNHGMENADNFVFSGSSAGGLSVFLHANHIMDRFSDFGNTKIVALPLHGFFLNSNGINNATNYSDALKWVYDYQSVESSIDGCKNYTDTYDTECIFAENVANHIKMPTFILNSQYDSWQIDNIMQPNGSRQFNLVNEYGVSFMTKLNQTYLQKDSESHDIYGAYIDSCYRHGDQHINNISYWSDLRVNKTSPAYAFKHFWDSLAIIDGVIENVELINDSVNHTHSLVNGTYLWYHNESYPCPDCCPLHIPLKVCFRIDDINETMLSAYFEEKFDLQNLTKEQEHNIDDVYLSFNGLYHFGGYLHNYPFYMNTDHESFAAENETYYLLFNEDAGKWILHDSLLDISKHFLSWNCETINIAECNDKFQKEEYIFGASIRECQAYSGLYNTTQTDLVQAVDHWVNGLTVQQWRIIGVFGSVVLCGILVVVLVICCIRRRNKNKSNFVQIGVMDDELYASAGGGGRGGGSGGVGSGDKPGGSTSGNMNKMKMKGKKLKQNIQNKIEKMKKNSGNEKRMERLELVSDDNDRLNLDIDDGNDDNISDEDDFEFNKLELHKKPIDNEIIENAFDDDDSDDD